MFRRYALRLCSVTLGDGTVLQGKLNPKNRQLLLSGTAILPDGRVFSGEFDSVDGHPLPGSKLEEDGDLYRGAFNTQWQRHGQGEAWLADGTQYTGEFIADELTHGTVRIPNGTNEVVFEGSLKDEAFVEGKLTQHDFSYTGKFKENSPHGRGKLVFTSGAEQEGSFMDGKLHGQDCKMKLDSGFVYIGEFMGGSIQSGTLYTPTYTYEGEFNEHGRAHGEGSQTYLINDPKLTFTGVWNNGAMVRGTCVDEDGSAVDWQDNFKTQQSILGGDEGDSLAGGANVVANSYCSAKLKEADAMHKDMHRSYTEDAEAVHRETGSFPCKMDLGYEGGIQAENQRMQAASRSQVEQLETSKPVMAERLNSEYENVQDQLHRNVVGSINENMAQLHFTRQVGAQHLSSQRMDEQFERFMKDFDHPKSEVAGEVLDEDASSSEPPSTSKLHIDGNAPWKTFTHK